MRAVLYSGLAFLIYVAVVLARRASLNLVKAERAAQEERVAANAAKDLKVQEALSDLMRAYVEGLDVIRADRRWKGDSMTIVAWGPRDNTRGTTTQSVLCQASFGSWAIIGLRVDQGVVHACSFEMAGAPQLKRFLEPFPDLYVRHVGEPLLA